MKKLIHYMSFIIVFILILSLSVSFASTTAEKVQGSGNNIIRVIRWAGYLTALGMLIFIGIKYMLGAADAKANMKTAIVNWLMGALMVFMTTTIITWVFSAINASPDESTEDAATKIVDTFGKDL